VGHLAGGTLDFLQALVNYARSRRAHRPAKG
jgi:hypothetical protein